MHKSMVKKVNLFFRSNAKMGTECDWSDFDREIIIGARHVEYLNNCTSPGIFMHNSL